MLEIEKVLNSSVILVKDEKEQERIILQKGIGYGRKQGEFVEALDDSRVFIPFNKKDSNQLIDLLSSIPSVYLEITQKIVLLAEESLGVKLNKHIYLVLTDHLHFAVERMEQKMIIVNRVFWELKTFYHKEFQIGLKALDILEEEMNIRLPEDEAANIAFHIINAQNLENDQFDSMRAAKLIGNVVTMITYSMGCQPDKESIHYSRFISHMQYFAERFFTDRMMSSEDDFLYGQMSIAYPKAIECAEKIRTYIVKGYDKFISNEEVAYLALHIQRLASRDK